MLRLFGLMVVLPGVVLLLFGLRALKQERREANQQIRDRLDRSADLALQVIDQQLTAWQQFRDIGVSVRFGPGLTTTPPDRLAYDPGNNDREPASSTALDEAERAEIQNGNYPQAIHLYQVALKDSSPALRTTGLIRLARTYRKANQNLQAIAIYRLLAKMPDQRVGLIPAELIGRFELCGLGQEQYTDLYRDLVAGRWRLHKANYLYYSENLRQRVSAKDPAQATEQQKLAMASAVEMLLQTPGRVPTEYLAIPQENGALIVPARELQLRLEHAMVVDRDIRVRLVDKNTSPRELTALRQLSRHDLPWAVEATPANASALYAGFDRRRTIYMSMLVFVFALLLSGSVIIVRTVRREIEIARMKSEFVSTVSHEFRSPLTAIRQLSEMLMRGRVSTEDKRQEYYRLISNESDRLSRLVENLLDFARIEDGRKEYYFERLNTTEWLRGIAAGFRADRLCLSIPAGLPCVLGDGVALASAVDNLLDNAVKYSPKGSPVFLEAESRGPDVTIRVRDQGCGIPPEDQTHIFEKFYRARGEISQQVKGSGVGLSLVQQIVKAHGGKVGFESRFGNGSVFWVSLKAIVPNAEPAD